MSISVVCSMCGAELKAPDQAAGEVMNCPKCRGGIRVPSSPEKSTSPPDSPARLSWQVPCPGCGRTVNIAPERWSRLYECKKCRTIFFPAAVATTSTYLNDDERQTRGQGAARTPTSTRFAAQAPQVPGPADRSCPFGAETILAGANKCRLCGQMMELDLPPILLFEADDPQPVGGLTRPAEIGRPKTNDNWKSPRQYPYASMATLTRQPDDGGYRNNLMATGILFIVFGSFILVGGLVGLTECSLMDTTVPMYAWSNSPRVHNFALLSVKQNGLILASIASSIGFLTIVASIFLIVLTRRPRNG